MTVRAILNTKGHQIVSVSADDTLSTAVKLLAERRIGAVLVLRDGKIEGILSERDVVRSLAARGPAALEEAVDGSMTRKVTTCRQTDTVTAIMEVMTAGRFRHLPVVEDERVVGIISIGDVVKRRLEEFENERAALQDYIKTA